MNNLEKTISPTIRVVTGGYNTIEAWRYGSEKVAFPPAIPTIAVPELTLLNAGVQAEDLKHYSAHGQPETD